MMDDGVASDVGQIISQNLVLTKYITRPNLCAECSLHLFSIINSCIKQ